MNNSKGTPTYRCVIQKAQHGSRVIPPINKVTKQTLNKTNTPPRTRFHLVEAQNLEVLECILIQ